ncbi:hypothetical protein CHS0354_019276 [Potamilus streckersoni]|uniref:Uncharacterized protein n=1 Tax=Potamilus streckersoni TaxID=2493646 RepID=A0AAE0RM74_9BIVA|nr:hypothetical protein CHS0354_019276 [Potamilus streckersoni]
MQTYPKVSDRRYLLEILRFVLLKNYIVLFRRPKQGAYQLSKPYSLNLQLASQPVVPNGIMHFGISRTDNTYLMPNCTSNFPGLHCGRLTVGNEDFRSGDRFRFSQPEIPSRFPMTFPSKITPTKTPLCILMIVA